MIARILHCLYIIQLVNKNITEQFALIFIITHLGLVESSGSSQWELLSIVDNKQRGSQERMIEKLRHTVEHKEQLYIRE